MKKGTFMLRSLAITPCDHDRHGRYCSKCGQEVEPAPLTFATMATEFVATWLQRGFRATVLGLTLAPGQQIRHYLRQDRSLLVKPVSYLVIMSAFRYWTVSLHSRTAGKLDATAMGLAGASGEERQLLPVVGWVYDHFYQIQLVQAALLALMLRFVFFRRSGTSLPEFTIAMTYILAQSTMINGLLHLFSLPFGRLPPEMLTLAAGTGFTLFGIVQFLQVRDIGGIARVLGAQMATLAVTLSAFILAVLVWLTWTETPA